MDLTEKVCTLCKATKPLGEFYPRPVKRDGLRSECKPCVRLISVNARKKDPEKMRAKWNEYSASHREELRAKSKARYDADPAGMRERSIRSTRVNRWYSALVTQAVERTKRKGWPEGDLTAEFVLHLYERQAGKCHWLGVPMTPSIMKRDPRRPSLDRLDQSIGYMRGNVVLCCMFANMGRSELPHGEFEKFVTELHAAIRRPGSHSS